MTAITVANKDWDALEDVADALAGATISGQAVFAAVALTTAEPQSREVQLTGDAPRAVLRYLTTVHADHPEAIRACTVEAEILIAAKVAPDADERDRVEEILRLTNAAINAVEADPPDDAVGLVDGKTHRPPLEWGRPKIDASEAAPWVLGRLPLKINLTLDSNGLH